MPGWDHRGRRARAAALALALLAGPAAAALPGPPAAAQEPGGSGVTYLCGPSRGYDCMPGTGYRGQSVWGSYGPGHNCVSYVAYMLQRNGAERPWAGRLGDGGEWDEHARAAGYRVDGTPAVGAVAQFEGGSGHVAYVNEVTPTHIVVTEDAYGASTSMRRIERTSPTFARIDFLHLHDLPTAAADMLVVDGDEVTLRPGAQGVRIRVPAPRPVDLPGLAAPDTVTAVGDFDGDGTDDVLLLPAGGAPDQVAWGDGDGTFTVTGTARPPLRGTYRTAVGDFDGNGADDVLLHGPGAARDGVWWGRPGARRFVPQSRTIAGRYRPVAGDLDGDGHDDVLLHAEGDAPDRVLWGGAGPRAFLGAPGPAVGGTAAPVAADLDGDGADDLFSLATGQVWWGGSRTLVPQPLPGAVGEEAAAADLDADGVADLVLFGPGPAPDAVWWGSRSRTFTAGPLVLAGDRLPLLAEVLTAP